MEVHVAAQAWYHQEGLLIGGQGEAGKLVGIVTPKLNPEADVGFLLKEWGERRY